MTLHEKQHSRSKKPHPYLHGNFAPVHKTLPLTPCSYAGTIPAELAGGQYVRNGGNPVTNEDLGRDAHWFDGDGMLSGVAFIRTPNNQITPHFVNQFILTDVYLSTLTTHSLKLPILPSIATLVNPASSLITIILRIFRTIFLVILSHLPGSQQAIKKISVANTGIYYHDGRALATCESGPPMRFTLPDLSTVGWYDGRDAENEPPAEAEQVSGEGFGGSGLLKFMKEWTTAHPRIDPVTKDLILYHSTFVAPFVQYSVIPSTLDKNKASNVSKIAKVYGGNMRGRKESIRGRRASMRERRDRGEKESRRLVNAAVPGVKSAKMMHDFGVSSTHTVIMDLPLSLDPRNLIYNEPVVSYDPSGVSRFGVFPRWDPSAVRWFETRPCCIFHTANTWSETSVVKNEAGEKEDVTAVNMLACRLTSSSLVFSAGNVAAPQTKRTTVEMEEEQCRLYYYRFNLSSPSSPSSNSKPSNTITHEWALSAIPFEFPSLREDRSMKDARFIYGCSVSDATFGAALGRAVKIDSLVKVDVQKLIAKGKEHPPEKVTGCVDMRSVAEILAEDDPEDAIRVFKLPPGWYAQESRFVPRDPTSMSSASRRSSRFSLSQDSEGEKDGSVSGKWGIEEEREDDGYLLTYVFDESQLDERGEMRAGAKSELWVVDARDMKTVVCKVKLPQRVPYGLHGSWFGEEEVRGQRGVERVRSVPNLAKMKGVQGGCAEVDGGVWWDVWMGVRGRLLGWLG